MIRYALKFWLSLVIYFQCHYYFNLRKKQNLPHKSSEVLDNSYAMSWNISLGNCFEYINTEPTELVVLLKTTGVETIKISIVLITVHNHASCFSKPKQLIKYV